MKRSIISDDDENDYNKRIKNSLETINEFNTETVTESATDNNFSTTINRIDLDDKYRSTTIFKNGVVTITTNLRINLTKFTRRIGGQLTSILSGNRLVIALKPLNNLQHGHRYSFLCFSTGKFILTNLFYINHLQDIYNFLLSFFVLLINRGIARVTGSDSTLLKFTVLVENCSFSFRFNEDVFKQRILSNNQQVVQLHQEQLFSETTIIHTSTAQPAIEELALYLCDLLATNGHTPLSYNCSDLGEQDKPISFPAICIKIHIKRDGSILKQYKSPASIRRNKNNFNELVISISFFANGKIIGTGMATQTDRFPWEIIAKGIFTYFLKR